MINFRYILIFIKNFFVSCILVQTKLLENGRAVLCDVEFTINFSARTYSEWCQVPVSAILEACLNR